MKRILTVLLLLACAAAAQEMPKYELTTGFSYGSIENGGGTSRLYGQGWMGSFATNIKRWVAIEADASGQYNNQSLLLQSTNFSLNSGFYSFLAGPKVSYRHGRVTPFAHGLVGLNRTLAYDQAALNSSNMTISVPYENALGAAVGGGVDYAISRRIALRTQADYFVAGSNNGALPGQQNNFRVIGGIVFAFGGTSPDFNARKKNPPAPIPAPAPADAVAEAAPAPAATAPAPVNAFVAPAPAAVTPAPAPAPAAPATEVVATAPSAPPPASEPVKQEQTLVAATTVAPAPAAAQTQAAAPPFASAAPTARQPIEVIISGPANEMQQAAQPQESLGDIARRYREQKLRQKN